jgi:hypothetical protein
MTTDDTVKLLRECDAGVKMGVASIKEVQAYVHNGEFRRSLERCRASHEALGNEVQEMLEARHDDGKEPGSVAKGMSWMKTNVMLAMNDSDSTIADLITDGCNMGVKSLHRYLNQYETASPEAKDVARRLSDLEEKLVTDVRPYL